MPLDDFQKTEFFLRNFARTEKYDNLRVDRGNMKDKSKHSIHNLGISFYSNIPRNMIVHYHGDISIIGMLIASLRHLQTFQLGAVFF